jgi:hypothetical protein
LPRCATFERLVAVIAPRSLIRPRAGSMVIVATTSPASLAVSVSDRSCFHAFGCFPRELDPRRLAGVRGDRGRRELQAPDAGHGLLVTAGDDDVAGVDGGLVEAESTEEDVVWASGRG